MNGEIILKAMTDIDDAYINDAADDTHIKAVFATLSDNKRHETAARKKVNIRYILIAAIICALLIAVASFTISSDFFNFNFPDGFVTVEDGDANIDIHAEPGSAESYNDNIHPVIRQLSEMGIDNVALPTVILEEWTQTRAIRIQNNNELMTDAELGFENGSMKVSIQVIKYADTDFVPEPVIRHAEKGELLEVNGLAINVFYTGSGSSLVEYLDGNTMHSLQFSWCYYDEVIEILKTIGAPSSKSEETSSNLNSASEHKDDAIVMAIAKKQYDCLKYNDAKGMRELLSKDLLLDLNNDVQSYIDGAYETVEFEYGTNSKWELGEMRVEYYDERQVAFTREEYTKDERENAGFEAPLITEMCKVIFDIYITTDSGKFTEKDSHTILVKEDGEWKIW